jgi:hypothetical protein
LRCFSSVSAVEFGKISRHILRARDAGEAPVRPSLLARPDLDEDVAVRDLVMAISVFSFARLGQIAPAPFPSAGG